MHCVSPHSLFSRHVSLFVDGFSLFRLSGKRAPKSLNGRVNVEGEIAFHLHFPAVTLFFPRKTG
jgi:hypothetical protein